MIQKQNENKQIRKYKQSKQNRRLFLIILVSTIVLPLLQSVQLRQVHGNTKSFAKNNERTAPDDYIRGLVTMPYDGVSWKSLPQQVRQAAITLGYTNKTRWEMGGETRIFSKNWIDLSIQQKRAAALLGYTEKEWIGTPELVHIVNLYSPMDDTQSLVLESMRRAKKELKHCSNRDDLRLDVKLMAAVHPKDLGIVPTFFDSVITLKQTYSGRFPLFQEILNWALKGHVHMNHLIYTNADIVLHPNFYCKVKVLTQLRTYDAFTTNRITIPGNITMEEFFETTSQGKHFPTEIKHPGHDCFVFSKEIAQQMNFGKSFIGTTAFANEIMIQMFHYAKEPKRFLSFDNPLTYHRGNDKGWMNKDFNIHLKRGLVSAVCENGYEYYCKSNNNNNNNNKNMPMMENFSTQSNPLKREFCNSMQEKARKIWKTTFLPFTEQNSTKWCHERKEQHQDEFQIQIDMTYSKKKKKEVIQSMNNTSDSIVFYPWVERYIRYHKASIQNGRLRDGVPYIVYECKNGDTMCGGAGDRLLGMTKMFYFAMCTNRVFLIDAPFPVPLDRVLNPSHIQWNASFPKTKTAFDDMDYNVSLSMRFGTIGYRIPKTTGFPRKKLLGDILIGQPCESHFKENSWDFEQFVQEPRNAVNQAFWAMFQFDPAVTKRAESLKRKAGIDGPYAGLHARTGDQAMVRRNSTVSFRFPRATDGDGLLACYHSLQSALPNKFNGAYLASDNHEFRAKVRDKDPSIHYAENFRAFHIDKQVRKKKKQASKAYDGFVDTWAEILVLVDSSCLVLSQSMFSFAAHYIRGPKTCNVYLPRCKIKKEVERVNNMYYGEHVMKFNHTSKSDFIVKYQ